MSYVVIGRNSYDCPAQVAEVETLEELATILREDPPKRADEYFLDSGEALALVDELIELRKLTGRTGGGV